MQSPRERGLNINHHNPKPLHTHLASEMGLKALEIIDRESANIYVEGNDGETPLQRAAAYNAFEPVAASYSSETQMLRQL